MHESKAWDIFRQMLLATAECHNNSIIHRDIKLDNFLVKQTNSETGETNVKLTDFGIACKYNPVEPPSVKCGRREYVAPEVLSQPHYDFKVDCYGIGIILLEVLSKFQTLEFKAASEAEEDPLVDPARDRHEEAPSLEEPLHRRH